MTLLLKTNELLLISGRIGQMQQRFKYILVDSTRTYQPQPIFNRTGCKRPLQNICVVGDDAQSIYAPSEG